MRTLCGTILAAAIFGTVPAEGRVVGTSRMETLEFNTINKQPGWKLSLAPQKLDGDPTERAFYRAFRELWFAASPAKRLFRADSEIGAA